MRAFVQQPAAHVYKQFPVFCKVARVVHRRLHEYIFYKESGKACFAAFLKIALNDQIAATSVFFFTSSLLSFPTSVPVPPQVARCVRRSALLSGGHGVPTTFLLFFRLHSLIPFCNNCTKHFCYCVVANRFEAIANLRLVTQLSRRKKRFENTR